MRKKVVKLFISNGERRKKKKQKKRANSLGWTIIIDWAKDDAT